MFHIYVATRGLDVLSVSDVYCKCYIWMLHIFAMSMLQVYVPNVSSVSDIHCNCFI
jgi:hypothetical protein